VRCEVAQRGLSEAMDGAASVSPQIDAHRRSCPACTRFEEGAWRIRGLVRFDPSIPPAPDLVAAVMERIEDYEADRMLGWIPDPHPFRSRLQRQRFVLAALVTGLILGIVFTSGGLIPIGNEGSVAKAEEIPGQLVQAAKEVRGYGATLEIIERHWTRAVPERRFVATLAFRAPESFRVDVRDTTRYPSSEWPRNNLRLVTDGHTWQATGPDPCPAAALPVCPHPGPVTRSVTNRASFDSRSSMPTDAIVPMTVLAASNRIAVIGPDQVAGRKAVAVDLTYQDGASLFQYLRFLGSWRPFFPQDRVVLWLDRDTWFPLKYEVFPAPGPVRSAWASQMGLPGESSDNWIFKAEVRSFSLAPPRAEVFRVRPGRGATSEGFRDSAFPKPLGPPYPPGDAELMTPRVTEGLTRWRFGRFTRTDERPYRETLMAYASGLSWFTVTRVVGWDQLGMFGVGPFAETVRLPNGGTGYYDPATDSDPRRIALHTGDGEFLVATNLPRAGLIRIAASLAVRGRPAPAAWRIHRWSGGSVMEGLTLREAGTRTPFPILVPTSLPAGFQIAATQTVQASGIAGVTLVFRRPTAELDGFGLHLYQASGQALPPPTGADQQVVMVGGLTGRWSPQDHLLEWMDGAIYRSLQGPEFDLGTLAHVAESLRRPTSPVSPSGGSP
jgi:hypothetical protein